MGWRSILLVWASVYSPLRGELLPIRTYTIADGLPSDHIDCIVPDSRGFLWFCTPEGVARFDGYRFVNYGVEEGLPHRAVSSLLIDAQSGDLFVGTARGLSTIAKGGTARFTSHRLREDSAKNRIVAMSDARSGGLWIATPREILRWNDPQRILPKELRPGPILIQDVLEDSYGDLWVATSSGLSAYAADGSVQSFTRNEGLPGDWVETLLLDSRGRLWAGARGGLALLSRRDGHWSVENAYTFQSGLVGYGVSALAEARDGTLWIGTGMGVSRLRPGEARSPVFENLTRAQGLSDRSITALAEDPAGNMWIGTDGAGVMRIDRVGFTTYTEPDGLASDIVHSVFEDRAGHVLAVTVAKGPGKSPRAVNLFDGVRFHSIEPRIFAGNPSWGWNQILLQSHTGEWWAATDQGLCQFGPMNAAELNRRNPKSCHSYGTVFRIFEDSKGGIWASAQSQPIESGDRLMRWNPATNIVFNFPAPRIPGEPPNDLVSAFAEDRQGNIWMGLYKGGLYRYDGRSFRHFQQSDGVPEGTIFALLATESGLWIGSNGGGLGRIRNTADERPRVETYDTAQGLASNIVRCIVEDLQGRIYAGTGKGVDRLDPRTGHIRHFSTANGLAHGELLSAARDRSGALWFASKQGLSRLSPGADRPPAAPRILITDLRIGSEIRAVSQLGETRLSQLELKPSQNQLQAEFVGIDYEPGEVVRYSYKLEGADSDWSLPRNQHSVNYAALATGSFRFLVKAVTSEGVESSVPAEIDFTVLPPVWRRWWFQTLALSVVALMIFAAHRYRLAQMVSLERMRTAIATDLHDDIGASLSQIAILSEVARLSADGHEGPGEPLERVATLARELVDSMGDIVWSIRTEPAGTDSLIRRMRGFALDLLVSQKIDFNLRTLHAEEQLQLSLQARRHLFLMFKECIHNAARHSRCTAVVAELKLVGGDLVLTVEDNGKGLDAGELSGESGGTGIAGMRQRAKALGGYVKLDANRGTGCIVEIHVPTRRGPFAKWNV